MGLDMYLHAEKYYHGKAAEGAWKKKSERYDAGYWRKHPNLHGYIVQEFAEGVDECQEIELSADNIRQIIKASKENALPYTTGFFFGESTPKRNAEGIAFFEKALEWLETEEEGVWRSIIYRASW